MTMLQNVATGRYREPTTGRNLDVTAVHRVHTPHLGTVHFRYEDDPSKEVVLQYREFAAPGRFVPYNQTT